MRALVSKGPATPPLFRRRYASILLLTFACNVCAARSCAYNCMMDTPEKGLHNFRVDVLILCKKKFE